MYLAGARVLELFPVLNLVGRVGLGVGALSYAGAFEVAVTADRDAYPTWTSLSAALAKSSTPSPRRRAARCPGR